MWLALVVVIVAVLHCSEGRSLATKCSDLYPCTRSSYPFCYMEEGQSEGICVPGEPGKLLKELYNPLPERTVRGADEENLDIEKRQTRHYGSLNRDEGSRERGEWPSPAKFRPSSIDGGYESPPEYYSKRESEASSQELESLLENVARVYNNKNTARPY